MIKVKFSPEMTTTLSQMKVNANAKKGGLSTGMETFDATAKKSKATNLYRLFPYDARYESKLRKHGLHLWYVVEIDDNIDPKTAVAQFKQLKEVAVAEAEHEKLLAPYSVKEYNSGISTYEVLPFNDPYLKDQWHYDNKSQTGFGDADINLFEAWTKTIGANNIIVSVHDEGVDVNHTDLKNNIWINTGEIADNGLDDDGNGFVDDVNGFNFAKNKGAIDAQYHGTHVAGTIAAVNNNGKGVSGVAGGSGNNDGAKIMSLQIFGGNASVEKTYVYAANNGAVISQNSWGYASPYYYEQSILDAIDYFVAEAGDYVGSPMKGGIVIFAAGNSNSDSEWYPGYHPSAMAVASIGPEWKKASYSNFGAWIELSAPGGDQEYGNKNGVLSTIPDDQYAYMQGTSMACPHVSGIAALALANRTKQLTNTELWNKLITGTVGVDQYNPDYIGKMGTGAIDAALAIMNDGGVAPVAISNLAVTGIAQEFATLEWSVPADDDDIQPLSFQLYYHTEPITTANLAQATKTIINNALSSGSTVSYEATGLLGLTTYYFAVTSTDRWGNVSEISNVANATTNEGPSIAVDENSQSITLDIDVTSATSDSHEITILNQAAGILRWNNFMRHRSASLSYNAAGLNYPVVTKKKSSSEIKVATFNATANSIKLRSNEPTTFAYTPIEKSYTYSASNLIGETDTELTNSAAAKFSVSEVGGFNLTDVRMYLKHDPANGPVIVEVYKGATPEKNNLVLAQEYSSWGDYEHNAYITLNEQIYFEAGSTFWVVFHVPAGNLFPLGMGYETEASYSDNCYMSLNMGATWSPLGDLISSDDFAWAVTAASYNADLGNYLTLAPGSGDVEGNNETITTLSVDGSTLINGTYNANLVLTSNDAQNRELRVPVSVNVSGHKPKLKHVDIADFGSVFQGSSKTLELIINNEGYGNFNNPSFSITDPQFVIEGWAPWQIKAREEVIVKIKFSPAASGNINGMLNFTNGDQSYQIALFGMGAETSKMILTPESQTVGSLTIGDEVNAQITVENTGAYPLKYFIPGYDDKGISDNWPTDYHSYGYKFRSNYESETNPITYGFQDISTTGTNITEHFKQQNWYWEVDMGFDFPYYKDKMQKLYIAEKGFTTFDNTVNPLNTPQINNFYTPRGYISPIGTYLDYSAGGNIFYQVEADRIIVQYDNVWDGWNPEYITAQMVLYSNGDIRFFYENMGFTWTQTYLNILVEDYEKEDGILLHNYNKQIELYSGLAIGFDYPGPDIIASVQNGSGIIMPGSTQTVDLTLSTASLVEGTVNRYVNFISNDPANAQKSVLVQLDITGGGTAQPVVSMDTLAFGDVFQGAVRSSVFTVKNTGTADVHISSMTLVNGSFALTGTQPVDIKPGLYTKYEIQIPTANLVTLEDWVSINYTDGSHDTIYVTGKVVDAPAINVDLTTIQQILNYGETVSHPFTIENTGLANLEVTPVGKQWLTFSAPTTAATTTYAYEKYNDGTFYQWMDIRKTGTQMEFATDIFDKEDFWRELTLPFPIEFYGQSYTELKVGENGIISFDADPEVMFFTDNIPTTSYEGTFIMPYWTFGGFDAYFFPKEDVGIFYQFYDEKIIITWSYLVNNFGGMGDPVSAQVIIYKNGTMKFQYKVEENGQDLTSNFTAIGVQQNKSNGVSISAQSNLPHGNGLAFILTPASKYVIAPGSTLAGEIDIDAQNIYGGVYNENLTLQTNVPGSENLMKPVELTVNGEAVFTAPAEVDFGSKMIAFEWGSPAVNSIDLDFSNDGSAPFQITWAQMATEGAQSLSLMMLVDGWWGPEWTPVEYIYSPWAWETPVFTVMPGEKLAVKAIFYPSASGDYTDELILTTSIGEKRITLKGTGFEPPVMDANVAPIEVVMNTMTETTNRSIAFNNVTGMSDLNYEVSIDFGRAATARTTEAVATSSNAALTLAYKDANVNATTNSVASYNRTINHSDKTAPDTYVGVGGSLSFSLATKYNAGPQGFNLSHIESWFRTESLTEGIVTIEVRAGGNSISTATTLGEGQLSFTGSGSDDAGDWHAIALDEPVGIYPNEDFYVIVTYPLGLEYPQGTIADQPTEHGTYYYYSEGVWSDLQNISDFATMGWLMYAAEETAGNSSWLSITSSLSGTLAMGETGSVELLIEGAFSKRGDQVANIVIKSNDPENELVTIPVTLHMNEGPHFSNVPESIHVAEGETLSINMGVVDAEGNTFTIASAQTYPGLTHTFSNGTLTLTAAPDFGHAAYYTYTFTATDEHNAVSEINIPAEIVHTNRAPEFIGEESMSFNATGLLNEYAIEDFYSDPDSDSYTFTLTSSNATSVIVFASENQFLIRPMEAGEAKLAFVVTDIHGAVTKDTLTVVVDVVLGAEEEMVNNGLGVYPNPAVDHTTITVTNDWTGEVTITVSDVNGKQYLTKQLDTMNAHEAKVDVSKLSKGIYILQAVSNTKQAAIKLIKK
jgi:subtilisin family serine protease